MDRGAPIVLSRSPSGRASRQYLTVAAPWDEDSDEWQFRRYKVTFSSVLGSTNSYGVLTRLGEHKAVAIALRNHVLGPHGFFEDFPLRITVVLVDGEFAATDLVELEASDLGDLNED